MKSRNSKNTYCQRAGVCAGIASAVLLCVFILTNLHGADDSIKRATLKTNITLLRTAIDHYQQDHGFFPCSEADYNHAADPSYFEKQLTQYTDASGQVSPVRDARHRFGPYLQSVPQNPFHLAGAANKANHVAINIMHNRSLADVQAFVAQGKCSSGWYYEAQAGVITPNLGADVFPDEYIYY